MVLNLCISRILLRNNDCLWSTKYIYWTVLKIKTDFISKSAKIKIEKAGGSVTLLSKSEKKTKPNKIEKEISTSKPNKK